jgi:leader peptidase (prepilin peptidase)/N-methyltransferase
LQYYLAVWSLLLGLVIGSFLNVVIYRLPRHESLVAPGSHCPQCGSGISWYDNIPVLSWVLLRGRCRACRARISVRYPVVESLTGSAFLAAYLLMGVEPAVVLVWALIAVVVSLAFIYHDLAVIPNRLVFPATLCGLAASMGLDPRHWWYYLAGCAGAGSLALLLSLVSPGVTEFGQAKIALLLGAVFGPWALGAVPAAAILSTFAGITLAFGQRGRLRARTVFAPYVRKRT